MIRLISSTGDVDDDNDDVCAAVGRRHKVQNSESETDFYSRGDDNKTHKWFTYRNGALWNFEATLLLRVIIFVPTTIHSTRGKSRVSIFRDKCCGLVGNLANTFQ